MIETITSDEFIAEMLSQEVIEEVDEMIICITDGESDGTEDPCDEEAEDECLQEEEE